MLESIEIRNFRSCRDVRVRLSEPVVALLGKNGAGKTNVLLAIRHAAELALGEPESASTFSRGNRGEPLQMSLVFSAGGSKYTYTTTRGSIGRAESRIEESLLQDDQTVFNRVGGELISPLSPSEGGIRIPPQMGSLFLISQFYSTDASRYAQLKKVSDYLRAIRYYALSTLSPEYSLDVPTPIVELANYEKWKTSLAIGRPWESASMRLLHLYLTADSKLEELRTLVGENGLGLISDIRIEEVHPARSGAGGEPAYIIEYIPCAGLAGAGRPFRYSGLSTGTWRVLRLLTYMIFDEASCMLVEQPEDSIHSGLLGKLLDVVDSYSERTQFICTTHSPRVMNMLGARSVRIVASNDGETTVSELSAVEIAASVGYLADQGTLSEFLETL